MKRSLLLLPALLLAHAASAQDAAFDARVADVGLLQAKQVQADLKITPGQLTKMNVAAAAHTERLKAYQKTMEALGSVAKTPDRQRLQGMFEQLKKEVFAVLTPTQIRRLRELTLQRLGLISLTDPGVSKTVGLSSAQVARLKAAFQTGRTKFVALQATVRDPILAPYKGRKPKDEAEAKAWQTAIVAKLKAAEPTAKPKLEAIGKSTDVAMNAVLTGPQRAKWNALKGQPFKAK